MPAARPPTAASASPWEQLSAGLVIAIVLAIVALQQRNLARENAVLAQDKALAESYARSTAVAESHNRATAEANALNQQATAEAASTQAVEQRDEARRQAKLALAGKLAAQSQLLLEDQLDLALLLGAETSRIADTPEARLAPRLALEHSPRLRRIIKNTPTLVRRFSISPDGQTLAVSECTETVQTDFLPKCGHSRLLFYNLTSGEATGQALDLGPFSAGYLAYSRLDGGGILVLVGYSSVALWDVATGNFIGEYPTGQQETRFYPTAAAFSPNGRLLAIGSCADRSQGGDANGYCNLGEVRLWDIEKRQLVGMPIATHESNVNALAFSPDSLDAGFRWRPDDKALEFARSSPVPERRPYSANRCWQATR